MKNFLRQNDIRLSIEPTEHNPMGPEHWQAHFAHYALWVTTEHDRRGIPLYFSYGSPQQKSDAPQRRQPTRLSPEFILTHIATVLCSWQRGYEFFVHKNGLENDPEGARFYFEAIGRLMPDLERLLGKDGLATLVRIGARQC